MRALMVWLWATIFASNVDSMVKSEFYLTRFHGNWYRMQCCE